MNYPAAFSLDPSQVLDNNFIKRYVFMKNIFTFTGQEDTATPQLVVNRKQLIENTRHAIAVAGSAQRLWPHVKTHKMIDVTRLMISMGITKFKCATIAELEMCAMAGAQEALLAYPLVGPAQRRFACLQRSWPGTRFHALCDDLAQAQALSSTGEHFNIMIDVNAGMNRTGISPERLVDFHSTLSSMKNITVTGIHCYDGHRHEPDFDGRFAQTELTYSRLAYQIGRLTHRPEYLIMGGSPTFPCYAVHEDVSLSPGTLFINDYGYLKAFPDLDFPPAAAVLTRIVSRPEEGVYTLDLGYKGIASDPADRGLLLCSYPNRSLFQSEEHWVWKIDGELKTGDTLFVVPGHICPTSALYSEALVVEDGRLTGSWPVTARNRRINH